MGPLQEMLLWHYVLYSQYLEPQSFLGSHLDKPAPSSHCEDSGQEGSSILVSASKSRKMRTAQLSLSATTTKTSPFYHAKRMCCWLIFSVSTAISRRLNVRCVNHLQWSHTIHNTNRMNLIRKIAVNFVLHLLYINMGISSQIWSWNVSKQSCMFTS